MPHGQLGDLEGDYRGAVEGEEGPEAVEGEDRPRAGAEDVAELALQRLLAQPRVLRRGPLAMDAREPRRVPTRSRRGRRISGSRSRQWRRRGKGGGGELTGEGGGW